MVKKGTQTRVVSYITGKRGCLSARSADSQDRFREPRRMEVDHEVVAYAKELRELFGNTARAAEESVKTFANCDTALVDFVACEVLLAAPSLGSGV